MSRISALPTTAILLIAIGGLAMAHSGATGVVKERMSLMTDIAAQMKIIGNMLKGERVFEAELVGSASQTMSEHADRMLELFPDSSNEHPSEALAVIWTDWDEFERLTSELKGSAIRLSDAAVDATDATMITPEFVAVGKTCSACHEKYRKSK